MKVFYDKYTNIFTNTTVDMCWWDLNRNYLSFIRCGAIFSSSPLKS